MQMTRTIMVAIPLLWKSVCSFVAALTGWGCEQATASRLALGVTSVKDGGRFEGYSATRGICDTGLEQSLELADVPARTSRPCGQTTRPEHKILKILQT